MGRIYDRKLECGCWISSDGGGGVIPCYYSIETEADKKQAKKCAAAWAAWRKTKDYKLHLKEVEENNQ